MKAYNNRNKRSTYGMKSSVCRLGNRCSDAIRESWRIVPKTGLHRFFCRA